MVLTATVSEIFGGQTNSFYFSSIDVFCTVFFLLQTLSYMSFDF